MAFYLCEQEARLKAFGDWLEQQSSSDEEGPTKRVNTADEAQLDDDADTE